MICKPCLSSGPKPGSTHCANCGNSAGFKLCAICSRGFAECEICRAKMGVPPPGVRFTRLFDQDIGKSVRLLAGEELHITLTTTAGSTTWGVKSYPRGTLSYVQTYSTAADPTGSLPATQTFVFMVLKPGQGKITVSAGSQNWDCTVRVK